MHKFCSQFEVRLFSDRKGKGDREISKRGRAAGCAQNRTTLSTNNSGRAADYILKRSPRNFGLRFFFRVKVLFFGTMALRNPPEIFRVKGLPDRLQNGFVIIIKKLALTS